MKLDDSQPDSSRNRLRTVPGRSRNLPSRAPSDRPHVSSSQDRAHLAQDHLGGSDVIVGPSRSQTQTPGTERKTHFNNLMANAGWRENLLPMPFEF